MDYLKIHYEVRKLHGKPSICEVCSVKDAKKYDWANVSKKYNSLERNDWKRLCRACHIAYDKSNEHKNKPILMLHPNGSQIKYPSLKIASLKTKVNYKSISNVLCNRANTAGGYGWRYVEEK